MFNEFFIVWLIAPKTRQSYFQSSESRGIKRKSTEMEPEDDSEEEEVPDEVRLWEAGFKDRYYESKFDVTSDNVEFRYKVALEYVRGLCWVLQYYYQVQYYQVINAKKLVLLNYNK